jgi:hypothetical protein
VATAGGPTGTRSHESGPLPLPGGAHGRRRSRSCIRLGSNPNRLTIVCKKMDGGPSVSDDLSAISWSPVTPDIWLLHARVAGVRWKSAGEISRARAITKCFSRLHIAKTETQQNEFSEEHSILAGAGPRVSLFHVRSWSACITDTVGTQQSEVFGSDTHYQCRSQFQRSHSRTRSSITPGASSSGPVAMERTLPSRCRICTLRNFVPICGMIPGSMLTMSCFRARIKCSFK